EVALVEVGLGGRLDATHAWDGGVAVVTNVALDHMDRLGATIPAIAREKAAIVERGDLAVTGATGEGLAMVRRRARRLGVPLTAVVASMADKDVDGVVLALAASGSLQGARIITTQVDLSRALPADALAKRWRSLVPAVRVESVPAVDVALDRALREAPGAVI